MKLIEALDILNNAGYITESVEFSGLDHARFSRHSDLTKKSKDKRNALSKFKDTRRYNDGEGIKWTYVKKRDDLTLKCAIVDGMLDTDRVDDIDYDDITSEEQIDRIIDRNDFTRGITKDVLEHLHKYMKGTTTVYRGFRRTWQDADMKDPRKKNELLRELSNTNKEFNSFTTDIRTAESFAGADGVIMSADVEPNDIMFAFTAYLMGRHGGPGENELNISNMKALRNVRFLTKLDVLRIKGYRKQVYKFADGSVMLVRPDYRLGDFTLGHRLKLSDKDFSPEMFILGDKNMPDGVLVLYDSDCCKLYCDGKYVKPNEQFLSMPHFMSDSIFYTRNIIFYFDRDNCKATAVPNVDYISERPGWGRYCYQVRIWEKDGTSRIIWVDGELNQEPEKAG